ncbi:Gfo/Idh/MocA family protein [Brevibacillus centrosporus]|uniref:Predicted dehydrogenase n=1 Tax=Brevibacillus centrosporus TaxID=54910 RepID=A0A1I4E4R2_9BACL|nr:Gfo/Idh/MocA family oxidoreductase [Brevibacillus centrosporus]SFL00139.1 Predicted dehydrogenase [Brevibacillus centrosporus]
MTIGVGIIGTGWVVETIHLPFFLQDERISRVCLFDTDLNRAEHLGKSDPRIESYPSIDKIFANQEIDLVVICTPNYLHAEQIRKALHAGKIVLCEKPICINDDEVNEITSLFHQYPNKLYVSLPNRFREDIKAVKNLLIDKQLGDIYRVRASWLRSNGIPRSEWFFQQEKSGGGVLIDLGSHLIDLVLWLLDFPVTRNISAILHNKFMNNPNRYASWHGSNLDLESVKSDVEDNMSAFITFSEGVSCTIDLGWAGHNVHDETVIEFFGDRGHLKLKTLFGFSRNTDLEKSLLTFTRNSVQEIQEFDLENRKKPYNSMFDSYLSSIMEKKENCPSYFNTLKSIGIISHIYHNNKVRGVCSEQFSSRF